MLNNKIILQEDSHATKSKGRFIAFSDRLFQTFFTGSPHTTNFQTAKFISFNLYCIPAIFKITNCISRFFLSKDKYPICKLDFFPLPQLTIYFWLTPGITTIVCTGSNSTPIQKLILKKSWLLFHYREISYFY